MYVPKLAGRQSAERGDAAYQHPSRNEQFNPELDRFSSLVIDMALNALAVDPSLWDKYSGHEKLLFQGADIAEPDRSKLLSDMEAIPDLRAQVNLFRSICKGPLEQVPRLADFLASTSTAATKPVSWLSTASSKRPVVYDAHDRDLLLKHMGEDITVAGEIVESTEGEYVQSQIRFRS